MINTKRIVQSAERLFIFSAEGLIVIGLRVRSYNRKISNKENERLFSLTDSLPSFESNLTVERYGLCAVRLNRIALITPWQRQAVATKMLFSEHLTASRSSHNVDSL